MPKTFGVSAHAAGVGGDADPSRLRVSPAPNPQPLEAWRERMAEKTAQQAALRQRTRAAANAPAAAVHPPLESAAAKRARRDLEIVKAYTSDPTASLATIAAQFEIGRDRISEILADAGVKVRRGRPAAAPKPAPAPTPPPAPITASLPDPLPAVAVAPPAAAVEQQVQRASWHELAPEEKTAPASSAFRADRLQRVAAATAAYLAGETIDALAGRFHLQKAYLRQQLREAGVTLRDDRRTRSGGMNAKTAADDDPTVAAAIVDAYTAGQPIAAIAATVPGASSSKYVTNVLRRHGVTLRPSVTGAHSDAVATGVRNEQIVAAWHATPHPTQQDLADRFGVTRGRIGQILAAAGALDPLVRLVEHDEPALDEQPVPPVQQAPTAPPPSPAQPDGAEVVRAARRVVTSLLDVAVALAGLARDSAQLEIAARDALTRLEDLTEGALP